MLLDISKNTQFALFENNAEQTAKLFYSPIKSISCNDPKDLDQTFNEIQEAQQQGLYLAGYCSYELGYCFEEKLLSLLPTKRKLPLIHFNAFEEMLTCNIDEISQWLSKHSNTFAAIHHPQLAMTKATYQQKLEMLKTHIKDGDTYQANFTTKLHFDFEGDTISLYQALREQQKVEYAALFLFDESPIISLSPECFFKKEETKITVKPMKGTAPRGRTPHEDAEQKNFLKNDEKNRAENIIIVDLLRNDLSRIAEPHSVQTTRLFDIETYETLLQMTSTITANIRKELPIATILKHLFPCGSITGAPKIRTMEILRELEKTPREIYTGTIGFITPDNDMHFNVAIRTLLLNQDNTGELGIGGGIIYESDSEKEYEEILLKAKFLTNLNFQLIECFLFDKNYRYLDDHLTRLKSSANTFCFSFDEKMIRKKLDQLKSFLDPKQQYKIKLSLNKKGEAQLTTDKISLEPRNKKIALANITMNSKDAILQHKTTAAHIRGIYDKALDQTSHYDVIFTNEKNEITEGARHNIFIEKDGSLYTPPITSGCLPGIMREKILTDSHYRCEEKVLTPEDLKTADKIYLTNSVRGMLEVDLA